MNPGRKVVYLAGKSARPPGPVLLPLCSTTISMVLAAISAGLEGSGQEVAKVVLIYVGILIEVVGNFGSYFFLRSYIRFQPERISERLACLSLIILGRSIL